MNAGDKKVMGHVWPPAVISEVPHAMSEGKRGWGWVSAWAAGSGLICLIFLCLLPDAYSNNVIFWTRVALAAGPISALAGIILGTLGRKEWRGQLGLAASLSVLVLMVSLVFVCHYILGQWPWERLMDKDSCGCG